MFLVQVSLRYAVVPAGQHAAAPALTSGKTPVSTEPMTDRSCLGVHRLSREKIAAGVSDHPRAAHLEAAASDSQ
jgi:hypothetical protein